MERSRTHGCSIRLKRPISIVSQRRGMRLVRRKLRSSCWAIRRIEFEWSWIRKATLVNATHGLDLCTFPARRGDARRRHPEAHGPPRVVAREAPVARGPRPDEPDHGQVRPVLRVRGRALLSCRRCAPGLREPAHAPGSIAWRSCTGHAVRRRPQASPRETREGISDLQFVGRYRVPFQFSRTWSPSSDGRRLPAVGVGRQGGRPGRQRVLRPHRFVRGQPVRRGLLQGLHRARRAIAAPLGPVLGSYHPSVADNVRRLREISGLDEVSFHMSGTEAVMQAVRSPAITPAARMSSASAAPITAGGATCSRAWAIRCRRATPTR
jgi:hypothetical protein